MTLSTTVTKNSYAGNGVTTVFPFTFRVLDAAHLSVVLTDATNASSTQILNTDWTVEATSIGLNGGGEITMLVAPAVGETLTIMRSTPKTQGTDFKNQGSFYPEDHEDALDRAMLIAQELSEQIGRSIRVPFLSGPIPEVPVGTPLANKYVAFDASGNPTAVDGSGTATDAALVSFLQAGAGAVPRTMQSKMRDTVSVKDFGALGDGVTDDTAAINAAAAAVAAAGGGVVRVPRGTYRFYLAPGDYSEVAATYRVAALVLPSTVKLRGEGRGETILKALDATGLYSAIQMITLPLTNGVPSVFDAEVEDITIDGNYGAMVGAQPASLGSGIAGAGWQRCAVRRCHIKNWGNYAVGMQNGGYIDNVIEDNIFENLGADGIDVKDNPNGVPLAVSKGNRIAGNVVRNFGQWNAPATSFAGIDLLGIGWRVHGNFISEFGGGTGTIEAAIRLKQGAPTDSRGDTPKYSTVTGNVIEQTTATNPVAGMHIKSPFVTVSGNTVIVKGDGIFVEQAFVTVANNVVTGLDTTGTAAGLRATDKTDVVSFYPGADDAVFTANIVTGFKYGLRSGRQRVTFSLNNVNSCDTPVLIESANGASNRLLFNSFTNSTNAPTYTNNAQHQFMGNAGLAAPMHVTQTTGGLASLLYHCVESAHRFYTNFTGLGSAMVEQFRIRHVANAVNRVEIAGGATGSGVTVNAAGSDANIDLIVQPAGTGLVRINTAHTANADAPITGYIQVKDSAGTIRKLAVIA